MTHSNQQSNSTEELGHLFGVCECPEGDSACFYQREYEAASKRHSDDGWISAAVNVRAYRYIKANYLPREEVEAAIEQSLVSTDIDDSGIYDIVIDKDLLYYKLGLSINSGKRA